MIPTPAAPIQLFDTMRMTANPIIPASSPATGGTQGLEFFFGSGETIRPFRQTVEYHFFLDLTSEFRQAVFALTFGRWK